jgi:uncharacterized protein YbjT (DUF2867 family)
MILVTGATGFVGAALLGRLAEDRAFNGVIAAVRQTVTLFPEVNRPGFCGGSYL